MSSSVLGPSVARVGQRDVGHALNGHVHRRVGEGAAVRALEAHGGGNRAVELVADQRPVAHEVEGLPLDTLAVDPDGRQAMLHGAIAGHVHDGRAVAQRAQLVEGGERGPGISRLVADGPVELGGVPDRLVDREPEVRGVDDEVVGAGFDGRAPGASRRAAPATRPARRPSPSCRRRSDRRGTPSPGRPGAPACAWSRIPNPRAPAPRAGPAGGPGAGWPGCR